MGTRGSRPGREADHSPPSSVEIKNAWSDKATPPYVLIVSRLVKRSVRFLGT